MKLSSKNKTLLQALGIVGVSALTFVTMAKPDLIGYKHSIVAIGTKGDQIEALNTELKSIDNNITERIDINESIQAELIPLKQQYDSTKIRLQNTDFKLDLPSIFITVEQIAKKNNLDVTFIHNDITKYVGGGPVELENEIEKEEEEELDEKEMEKIIEEVELYMETLPLSKRSHYAWVVNQGHSEKTAEYVLEEMNVDYGENAKRHVLLLIKDTEYENQELYEELISFGYSNDEAKAALDDTNGFTSENIKEIKSLSEPVRANEESASQGIGLGIQGITNDFEKIGPEDEHGINVDVVQNNVPNIEGITITTVPIILEGSYSHIRSFITDMEAVDFIEPNFIDIYSYGDIVSAKIVYNVFHIEDQGGDSN